MQLTTPNHGTVGQYHDTMVDVRSTVLQTMRDVYDTPLDVATGDRFDELFAQAMDEFDPTEDAFYCSVAEWIDERI